MTRVAAVYQDDADVVTLHADAVMNTMPWDYWQKDGAPKPETAALAAALERTIEERRAADPGDSYTARLLADPALIGRKVEEEAEEVARAAR